MASRQRRGGSGWTFETVEGVHGLNVFVSLDGELVTRVATEEAAVAYIDRQPGRAAPEVGE